MHKLAALLALLFLTAGARAATITFEDLAVTGDPIAVPAGYQGFNWSFGSGINVLDFSLGYAGTGYEAGAVSGVHTAYNQDGAAETRIAWSGPGTFDLIQGYWTSVWASSHNVTFRGLNDGVETHAPITLTINKTTPALQVFNWIGIDELVVVNGNPSSQWVLDDLQFSASTSPVPAPGGGVLLTGGLVLLAFARRKPLFGR